MISKESLRLPHYNCSSLSIQDAFGLKPVDAVADLTTKDLVKRALAHGRHRSSSSPIPSTTGAEPQQQHRASPRVSSPKVMSPKTICLPPQFSSASLLLESTTSAAANKTTSAHAAPAGAAVVRASATDIPVAAGSSNTTKQAAAPAPPLPSSTARSPSRSNHDMSSNRDVGLGPLDAAAGGGRETRGEEGGVQDNLAVITPPASVEDADTIVTAKRGSWSRPIGPRPQIGKGGSSGGASGGGTGNYAGSSSGGDGMRSPSSSVKGSSGPKHRPKRQVVVVVDGDGVAESEEQQEQEAIVSSREEGDLVQGQGTTAAVVVGRESTTGGSSSTLNAGGSEVIGESGGGEVAASDSRRSPVRSHQKEGQSVVDPRVQAVVPDRD